MRNRRRVVVTLLALALLAGCLGRVRQQQEQGEIVLQPGESVVVRCEAATETPTATSTATSTATPVPPTETPTETPAPQQTAIPTPTPKPSPADVFVVLSGEPRQVIEDVGGGNFIHQSQNVTTPTEPVSELNLALLDPRLVRVRMVVNEWEPDNDNDDPYLINWAAFRETENNRTVFEFMRLLVQEHGNEGVTFVATTGIAPGWMIYRDPADSRRYLMYEDAYPEAAENILAWALYAQRNYGVEVDYVSFNEADAGVRIRLSANEYAAIIEESGPRFAAAGLETRWLWGDGACRPLSLEWARSIWRPSTREYLGPLSFHAWAVNASVNVNDTVLQGWAELAQSRGRPLWVTEANWALGQTYEEYQTWDNALGLAQIYVRLLSESQASGFLYWQMVKRGFPLNDGAEPFASMEMLLQLKDAFPVGTQMTGVTSTDSALRAAASRDTVVMVNEKAMMQNVEIQGLPAGRYYVVRSDAAGVGRPNAPFSMEGQPLIVEMAGRSVAFVLPLD